MSILALASDTLVGTAGAGQIEYNGQFFGTDSNASRAQLQRIVQGTAVASTSGTSIDFTSLPAWCKKITVMFNGVSSVGSSDLLIQLGDAGGIENTGYSSSYAQTTTTGSSTSGLILAAATSSDLWYGSVIITSFGSNTWTSIGNLTNTGAVRISAGIKATSDTLDRIRITVPSSTFDAGSINILYEG